MRDKYAVGHDPDCWPGTTVLRNRLGIRRQVLLDEAEAAFASLAAQEIAIAAPPFDADYLKHLHLQCTRSVRAMVAPRLFFEHWLLTRQFGADWRGTARDEWIAACVAAVRCDYAPLELIFERCILRIED